jgi:hypothetical protein
MKFNGTKIKAGLPPGKKLFALDLLMQGHIPLKA